ncbi:hypothetical protein [Flavobacterium sp.]|uniref:hypothetical protein n=1 Tax=Flavobacterium sp. TaxID=239 RepID=UPI003D10553F
MKSNVTVVDQQVKQATTFKLFLSIFFDLIGLLSYVFPGFAEAIDFIWAPISGIILSRMYKGNIGKIAGSIEFLEEILPFVDIIPTFTLTWLYVNHLEKKRGL